MLRGIEGEQFLTSHSQINFLGRDGLFLLQAVGNKNCRPSVEKIQYSVVDVFMLQPQFVNPISKVIRFSGRRNSLPIS